MVTGGVDEMPRVDAIEITEIIGDDESALRMAASASSSVSVPRVWLARTVMVNVWGLWMFMVILLLCGHRTRLARD